MTREQFEALTESYGANWHRWPPALQASGRAYLDDHPLEAEACLEQARWLDQVLAEAPQPVVSMALRDRVLADASRLMARAGGTEGSGLGRFVMGHLRLAMGAGWAVATCAGVAAGVLLSSQLTANMHADTVLYQASLDGADDLEILG